MSKIFQALCRGFDTRLKALSKEDIDELPRGGGRGLANTAELMACPDRHMSWAWRPIGLSVEQIEWTRRIRDAMRLDAKGRFRTGDISEPELTARVSEIELLRAKLRTVHLMAHIEVARVLPAKQIER